MLRLKWALPALLGVGALLAAPPALAHGFGERYDLPIPLGYFALGAAAAVILSFLLIGAAARDSASRYDYPRFNLFQIPGVEWVLTRPVAWALKLLSVFLFLLVILAGLLGTPRPVDNFAPIFIWVIWWVGFTAFVSLFGNLWAVVNPWKIIYEAAERVYGLFWRGASLSLGQPYPAKWGVWPAVILFFCFAWVENAFSENETPTRLAILALGYSFITLAGTFIYGKHEWLRRGEVFSVIYGLLSRFSITETRVPDAAACRECGDVCRTPDGACVDCHECFAYARRRELNLRLPAAGLSVGNPSAPSGVALVILLLATVTFDGFSATTEWIIAQSWFITQFHNFNSPYFNGVVIANTLGLLAFPIAFALVFTAFTSLMSKAVGGRVGADRLTQEFAFSLIPIALAYQLAHYLTFLLIQGQLIIPIASDPFGWGWNLFNTNDYIINIRLVTSRFVWFYSVGVIVLGHVISVALAHFRAMRLFGQRRLVIRSQLPMLGLMVLYTMVSLWIISRPITA